MAAAEKSEHEAVDLYYFTSVLKRTLDDAGRHKVIEMLWKMAMADGVVHEFEENAVWRVAELLGVSSRDRILLRQRVTNEVVDDSAPTDADAEAAAVPSGPWSGKPAT